MLPLFPNIERLQLYICNRNMFELQPHETDKALPAYFLPLQRYSNSTYIVSCKSSAPFQGSISKYSSRKLQFLSWNWSRARDNAMCHRINVSAYNKPCWVKPSGSKSIIHAQILQGYWGREGDEEDSQWAVFFLLQFLYSMYLMQL